MFLVLLRIAIGWHFLYEGLEKYESKHKGGKPFSAEPYLRASTGPFAPYFRGLVPDVNSLARLDPDRLKAAWTADVDRIANHFGFDDMQRSAAAKVFRKSVHDADEWFADKELNEQRNKYYHELREVQAIERKQGALSYERERAAAKRRDLESERRELVEDLDAIGDALHEAVIKLATEDQQAAAGPFVPLRTPLDWLNDLTTYGLIAMGTCLILGLCTPLAALGAAVFLAQIYLSMPPWPVLPPNPTAEGHDFIVSKNLVEMIACLVLVFIPTGHWIGFDALVFGRKVPGTVEETPSTRSTDVAPSAGTNPRITPDVSPLPRSSPGLSKRD
jgi:uncharacterized membrane protein YphA (DoxX/SURF4 family)